MSMTSLDFRMVRGSRIYTKRYVGVDDVGVDLTFPIPVQEIMVHTEGETIVCWRCGTVAGSEDVAVTSNGTWEVFPVVAYDTPIMTLKAPTGATANFSITAWTR